MRSRVYDYTGRRAYEYSQNNNKKAKKWFLDDQKKRKSKLESEHHLIDGELHKNKFHYCILDLVTTIIKCAKMTG